MMSEMPRRSLIAGLASAGALAIIGCTPSEKRQEQQAQDLARKSTPAIGAQLAAMTVYRDPSCGCCEAWAEIARKTGYQVSLIDHSDMPAIKRQYGVPGEFLSCHTAIAAGYAIEGHVPMEDVARLLNERPPDIKGIAVAGMPLGSPGMEVPNGAKQPFQVMAFYAEGRTSVFRG